MKSKITVKKSLLPGAGRGLFAKAVIKRGEQITEYRGRLERWKDVKHLDGHNGYLLRVSRTHAINAEPSKTLGRYANDANGLIRLAGIRNNSEYIVYGKRCFIEATRDIQKGEEILVSYGKEYWDLIRKIRKGSR